MAERPTLVWVPAFSNGQMRRFDSTFYLDDVMLADQFAILDALVAEKGWTSIVKCLRGADSSAVLEARVAEANAVHVVYSEERLSEVLPRASAALLDFPSSAMLECEDAGLPTFVLAYPGLHLRHSGVVRRRLARIVRYTHRDQIAGLIGGFLGEVDEALRRGTGWSPTGIR